MPAELHWNDNGTWRKMSNVYFNDNGTWRTLQNIYRNDNGTWREVYTAALPVNPAGGSFTNYQNAASATCRLLVRTDGSIAVQYLRNGVLDSTAANHNWYLPNLAGIGNTHWVRFTRNSESLGSNGTRSTTATTGWLPLTSDQLVDAFANATASNSTFAQANYTVDISTASGGSPIVATGTYTLRAESDRT